jgi:hypothetical protein
MRICAAYLRRSKLREAILKAGTPSEGSPSRMLRLIVAQHNRTGIATIAHGHSGRLPLDSGAKKTDLDHLILLTRRWIIVFTPASQIRIG